MKEFLRDLLITPDKQEYFALQDINSGAILTISKNFQTLNYISDFFMDTMIMAFPSTNYFDRKFYDGLIESGESYKFTVPKYNHKPIMLGTPDLKMKEKSELVTYKHKKFSEMYQALEIRRIRQSHKRALAFQEIIYVHKKMQATEFLAKGCPEDKILDYPYVKQYADYKKLSSKQAAEDILFKSKLNDNYLARTESIRLKHFNIMKNANSKEEIDAAHKGFVADMDY
jgi:hypothetical protein